MTLLVIMNLFSYDNNKIEQIRNLYLASSLSKSSCNLFEEELNKINKKSSLIQGYQGCLYFIKCKFSKNPFEVLMYFNKGKKLLEYSINDKPRSTELRLLRYTIQKNLPEYLSYYENIEEDSVFVIRNLKYIENKSTKDFIQTSLKSINQ